MNIERGVGRQQIGDWEFSPATGELRRRTEVRRLEPRAAKALELLMGANGEVVSQERLIAEVWGGRSLSDNSVAVVIGQLRRALDDDAKEPKLIETIPKRGYRLRGGEAGSGGTFGRRRAMLILSGAVVLALLLAGALLLRPGQAGVTLLVRDVVNETGNADYAPLVKATSELIVTDFGAQGFSVRRSGSGDLTVDSKLVMWDGAPFLGMTATDHSGAVRWSLMAKATPGKVPPAVEAGAKDLATRFPPKDGAARLANPATDR